MWQEQVYFQNDRNEKLCGNLQYTDCPQTNVLVIGPNPLLGGDMNNNVICAIWNVLREINVAALRFDYRGTGESEIFVEGGVIDYYQKLEDRQETKPFAEDATAAFTFLKKTTQLQKTTIIGYSFGAYIALKHFTEEKLLLICPPLGKYPVVQRYSDSVQCLIAANDFLDNELVKNIFPDSETVDSDHFFRGKESLVKNWILTKVRSSL